MKNSFPTLWNEGNGGFITIPILIIAILGTLVVGGGGYAVYKVSQIRQESNRTVVELEKKLQQMASADDIVKPVTEILDLATSTEDIATSTASTSNPDILANTTKENLNQTPEVRTIIKESVVYIPAPVNASENKPVVEPAIAVKSEPVIPPQNEYLKITDVDTKINGYVVWVSWKTNKNSDSRLVIEDGEKKTFVSEEYDSTEHEVKLSGLEYSNTYTYEIIAETNGEEDSHFGEVSTERKFEVTAKQGEPLEGGENCIDVFVIDTAGKPLIGVDIEISGNWQTGTNNFLAKKIIAETDRDGMVQYCDRLTKMNVENVRTGEIYYSGPVVII